MASLLHLCTIRRRERIKPGDHPIRLPSVFGPYFCATATKSALPVSSTRVRSNET